MQEKYYHIPEKSLPNKSVSTPLPVNHEGFSETDLSEKIIQQAFQNDPNEGIQCLFHCYHALLCSHAVRFVSSKAIAEDIVSDIFYEFHARQLYHTITTSYRAYLFASVRNRAFDYVRREVHRSNSLEYAAHVSIQSAQEPDSITQYENLCQDVEAAIGGMPIKRRQIYLMHRFEGKKNPEIARELSLSIRTVEAHLYQAIRQIREELRSKWFLLVLFLYTEYPANHRSDQDFTPTNPAPMNTSPHDDLLFRYFSGQASSLQKNQIEEWLRDTSNLALFYQALARWEKQNLQYQTDTKEAIRRHMQRMENLTQDSARQELSRPAGADWRRRTPRYWLAAASVVLLLCAAIGLYHTFFQYKTYATEYGQTLSFGLPDGSQVTLNANSSLRLPRFGFGDDSREVFLQGEAEFQVKHTHNNARFIVKTPYALDVVVLGTQFSVFARSRATRVALTQGKVQLFYKAGKKVQKKSMKPGELATLDQRGHQVAITPMENPAAPTAWKEHRFVFSATPLSEIALMVQEVFGVKILILEPAVAQMTVSGSFTAHDAEELIETLAEASTLTYSKNKRTITIQTQSN
ncbi:sigma-70 family RNA polymerase sigma factor [Salmonirosea aquatica]|uniref:Sigma-70 family RNA polymerase sigma factor n=1 Tax=Salmonirosea aquatica TaxID=2654236 RepID=A0A7C9BF13_9BACT|nr:sigma-70 family RNA polymerase sigma factor [Cytophagaceae bacterium SJW1-29]